MGEVRVIRCVFWRGCCWRCCWDSDVRTGRTRSCFCLLTGSCQRTIVGRNSVQQALVFNTWPGIIQKSGLKISFLSSYKLELFQGNNIYKDHQNREVEDSRLRVTLLVTTVVEMWSRTRSVGCVVEEVSQSRDWSYNLSKLLWYFLIWWFCLMGKESMSKATY